VPPFAATVRSDTPTEVPGLAKLSGALTHNAAGDLISFDFPVRIGRMNSARVPEPDAMTDPSLPIEPTLFPEPAPAPTATLPPDNAAPAPTIAPAGVAGPVTFLGAGVQLPGYDIIRELGRGGMGVVYQARQVALNRTVAVKMILAGAHAGEANLARFLTEAEAVAQLQHPHIVQIFEIGRHEGLPYFTLEFVPGGSLADKVRDHPLPAREAAQLVEQLAKGVAYAHQRGIIHRDLKPENVLLAEDGTPKITDFGLAKRVAVEPGAASPGSGLTATGAVLGTPSFMAPEQAGGKPSAIGPAADIYALGAILYRLVTGRPPFQAATPLDTILQVVSDDPLAPRQLAPKCPRDLETICLKCLQKEPRKRYASAANLSEDLRRFQSSEPIQARPVGRLERAVKWARRNPGVFRWMVAFAAVCLLFSVIVLAFAVRIVGLADFATRQANDLKEINLDLYAARDDALSKAKTAREAQHLTERANYFNSIGLAHQLWLANSVERAQKVLEGCPRELRHWEWDYLNRLVHAGELTTYRGHQGVIHNLVYAPTGTSILSTNGMGEVRCWSAATGATQWQAVPKVPIARQGDS
jgi:hypothetical protein